jgi:excisionase family DNA binding protein
MQSAMRVLGDYSPRSAERPAFLPVGQAAKALGVSSMTVRRLYDARKLPGFRNGRSRQILRAFVDGFVAEIEAGQQPVLQEYADAWFERAGAVEEQVGQRAHHVRTDIRPAAALTPTRPFTANPTHPARSATHA